MNTLIALAFVAGGLTSILSILSQVQLWQRKEYRWDRMRAYLRSPEWRQHIVPLPLAGTLAAGGAALAAWATHAAVATSFSGLVLMLFLGHHVWRTYRRGVFRPTFTLKAKLIVGLSTAAVALLIVAGDKRGLLMPLVWAGTVALLPLLTALAVGLVNIPAALRKRQIIAAAKRRRDALPDLIVIGITGSFGKTSTKHFAWQLLRAGRKDVAATSRHRNSEIGVAQDMLERLNEDLGVYIAEMGAYRRGEIEALAKLARPSIGVITAIGNQHLDLFGSREGILEAKWELIDALPGNGVAILNKDDEQLRAHAENLSVKVVWYSTTQDAEVAMRDWTIQPTRTTSTLRLGEFTQTITLPLLSEAMLQSATAAAAVAYAVGMPPKEIAAALENVRPMPRTMELKKGRAGATVIDDSYSANEHGVLTAVNHVTRFSEPDKHIVLVPLIEVGNVGAAVHQRIGEALARSGATVYVYGNAYHQSLAAGMKAAADRLHTFTDPHLLASVLAGNVQASSVVLLEGRVPSVVRQRIVNS